MSRLSEFGIDFDDHDYPADPNADSYDEYELERYDNAVQALRAAKKLGLEETHLKTLIYECGVNEGDV
jgi:hypothetical protein